MTPFKINADASFDAMVAENESGTNPYTVTKTVGFDPILDLQMSGKYAVWQLSGPSPVPVPAAVWLFGTALIGMFGFDKRRKAV